MFRLRGKFTLIIKAAAICGAMLCAGQGTQPAASFPVGLSDGQWAAAQGVVGLEPATEGEIAGMIGDLQRIDGGVGTNAEKANHRKEDLATLAKLRKRLAALKAGKIVYPTLNLDHIEKGAAGSLGYRGEVEPQYGVQVVQVVSKNEMIAKVFLDTIVWLKGYSSDGVTDGKTLILGDGPHYISGTRTYSTAAGSNTIFVLEPVPEKGIAEAVAWLKKHGNKRPAEK